MLGVRSQTHSWTTGKRVCVPSSPSLPAACGSHTHESLPDHVLISAPSLIPVPDLLLPMMRFPSLVLAAVCCILHVHSSDCNFVERLQQDDGQVVTRVRFNNQTIMRTSYAGFDLIEFVDKNVLIRMWYRGGELLDCGLETDAEVIANFMLEFDHSDHQHDGCRKDLSCTTHDAGTKTTNTSDEELPADVLNMMRNQILVEKCSQLQEGRHSGSRRVKRGLLFPGTNFCGAGSNFESNEVTSRKENEVLGLHVNADRCCQEHDNCRHYISPFSWKYQLFNYRIHTVSHCRCDERFRRCLKQANTPTANMIGKLFFNIGKTKCFRFKREKACKKRSWWGSCLKKGKVRRAYYKNGSPF